MEKLPSPENNDKKEELKKLLKLYPMPEQFNDKEELALKLKDIIHSLIKKDELSNSFKNFDNLSRFSKILKNKYNNASSYYLYNLLIGSTYNEERIITAFDFPAGDSIQKFLEIQELSSRLDD